MKRSDAAGFIQKTVDREQLWHALTPQFFRSQPLRMALEQGLACGAAITDEASAMELAGFRPMMVEGRGSHFDPRLLDAFLQLEDVFLGIAEQYRD